jgi:cyclophilin family peptidyl-prolyl cis-trans isomerase
MIFKHFLPALLLALAACTSPATEESFDTSTDATVASETAVGTDAEAGAEPTTGSEAMTQQGSTGKPMSYYQDKVAEIKTSEGTITVRFFPDVAPNHVKNFIDLAERGFYNMTRFHRVIPGFMIQGGDPNTVQYPDDPRYWGTGGSDTKLKSEFSSVKHRRGILSMARSSDPNSASSQFFIMVADAPSLDGQYSVFGQVTDGMDVADRIVNAPKAAGSRETPAKPVQINSITLRPATDAEKGPAPK